MKSKSNSSRVSDRYGMIEPLEPRIAPAAVGSYPLPANPIFVTATSGGSLLVKAGEVLSTGSGGGGIYLLYVAQGEVLVHTTDLANDGQLDFNDITGLSVGNGAIVVSFVDIHGDVVTDLNPDGTLSDGGKGDILLDNTIDAIDLRSLTTADFTSSSTSPAVLVNNHLAMSSYSIFGNIYAGGGFGLANDTASGLTIDNTGAGLQAGKYTGTQGNDYYLPTTPVIGSIYVGSSASGQHFSFGATGSLNDPVGSLLTFIPSPGEPGASIYNVAGASAGIAFSIGTLHAGDGGFNAPGGNIVNVSLAGNTSGATELIAGNAGSGTAGHSGGSIINFADTGAIQGELLLQSGTGGASLTGNGGNAGIVTFNPVSPVGANAHVVINLGAGGDGYDGGGNGGSAGTGSFVTPEGQLTTPLALVTSMHTIGSIGATQSIDFNGDGFSDAVFSTTNPDQVVVALGGLDQYGDFILNSGNYIYLNSPGQVESIAVGDFTGNGHPDIAVASGSGSFAGIEVYLSEYSSNGTFEGFSSPLFSPLPALTQYGGTTSSFLYTSVSVTKLIAGDFTGSGVMGLAAVVQETQSVTFAQNSVLLFLNGEATTASPHGTGYFYANFDQGMNTPLIDLSAINFGKSIPFNAATAIFEATALQQFTSGNGKDVLVEANGPGASAYGVIQFVGDGYHISVDQIPNILITAPTVPPAPPGMPVSTPFALQSFAVTQDPTNPAIADLAFLSSAPPGYLNILQGVGDGTFTQPNTAGIDITKTIAKPVDIVAVPNTTSLGSPVYSDVAILDYAGPGTNGGSGSPFDRIYVVNVADNLTGAVSTTEQWVTITPSFGNSGAVAFGTYDPFPVSNPNIQASGPTEFSFITANPITAYPDYQGFAVSQPLGGNFGYSAAPFKDLGYFVTAGNGGNSESGPGGAGGSLGQSLSITASSGTTPAGAIGSLSFVFPADLVYDGTAQIVAGNGGNGFTNAGAGGSLTGISVTYATTNEITGVANLQAGNGGQSLTGVGGAGGSLNQLYIMSGVLFSAGEGGIGVIGGAGGTLTGTPGLTTGQSSNTNPQIILKAGDGATGLIGGGNGGSILSFVNQFNPIVGGVGGSLDYYAGNAGNAVAGQAGSGGSIIDSSPSSLDNNLAGYINLQGGVGGSGLRGGSGGSIVDFAQISTIKDIPASSTIIAGAGGDATIGAGGTGGGISDVSVAAAGNGVNAGYTIYNFAQADGNLTILEDNSIFYSVTYNRMVAGPGGASVGGTGGAGGSINSVNTTSVSAVAQNVVVAGAGGDGLTGGGAGGSVISAVVDAGSASANGLVTGKIVVIAGDGGSSSSARPAVASNPQDIAFAIGGVDGPGGNGGSIIGFIQPTNTSAEVDLIAGNGGATINHSVAAGNATVDNSGMGGSISLGGSKSNPGITGSIGNCAADVAIQSYNDIFAGQSMQQFVNSYILGQPSAPMDDSVGNVGLVAGEAGRVEGGLPSSNGINGSVTNIYAENIMSMVAGNVDQVALIQSLTNYGVSINGGFLGAPKLVSSIAGFTSLIIPGDLNYISPDGTLSTSPLPGGGALIDGAFIAENIRVTESNRDFQGTEF